MELVATTEQTTTLAHHEIKHWRQWSRPYLEINKISPVATQHLQFHCRYEVL